jgi:CDP-diacylglycerol--glycerol-3-phosphate 3-phosphatidyltransferase
MKKYIPNLLTICRFLLVPVFVWLIFFDQSKFGVVWATAVFIIASITDYFDGYLARKFSYITNFGKLMDPLADKLLVIAAVLALTLRFNYVDSLVIAIIIFREVMVSLFREIFASKKIFIPANIWGKIKTVLQMFGIIVILIYHSLLILTDKGIDPNGYLKNGVNIFFWFVAIITLLSGFTYIFTIARRKY